MVLTDAYFLQAEGGRLVLQMIKVPVKALRFSAFHRDRSTNGAVSRLDRFVLG